MLETKVDRLLEVAVAALEGDLAPLGEKEQKVVFGQERKDVVMTVGGGWWVVVVGWW